MTTYYPDQRYAANLTLIRRECVLPEEAAGQINVGEGKRVDVRDVVARGQVPNRHIIIDAAKRLGLRNPDELPALMQVDLGVAVDEQQVLAGKNPKRGKRVFAPVRGIVMAVQDGTIILQQMPQKVELEAGVRGRVTGIIPGRGVVIEAVGAQMQGVWGNDKRSIATLRIEPEDGIETFVASEFDLRFVGAVILTTRPISQMTLDVMRERNFVGIIAPSADASLLDSLLAAKGPILLTEGFGGAKMSLSVFRLLAQYDGQQVTVDAHLPSRWEARRPEVIVNLAARADERPARPNPMLALRQNMTVRVTRDPYAGQTGKVLDLPKSPVLLPNGLRVLCARVELVAGEVTHIPLANLEVLGR
ncbi:MAG: hypothetical protein SF029_10440 [bacterium]|nr:hypothetical protein [bacterium]